VLLIRLLAQRAMFLQAAAQLAEGEARADPSEPGHAEEELQGASDQAIAAVNVEYGLTTPHEVCATEIAPEACLACLV